MSAVPGVPRALFVVALGLAVVIAIGVTVTWRTGRDPLSGCQLTSVDKGEYVAGYRAILDTSSGAGTGGASFGQQVARGRMARRHGRLLR